MSRDEFDTYTRVHQNTRGRLQAIDDYKDDMAASVNEADALEAAAKALYAAMPGASDHPWVDGGNSHKQDDARRAARAAMTKAGK